MAVIILQVSLENGLAVRMQGEIPENILNELKPPAGFAIARIETTPANHLKLYLCHPAGNAVSCAVKFEKFSFFNHEKGPFHLWDLWRVDEIWPGGVRSLCKIIDGVETYLSKTTGYKPCFWEWLITR